LLKARDRIARRIGVNCGHRSFVTGVHGLQHVESLFAAAFPEDNAVRTHTKGVLDQLALPDFTLAFDIGRPRFHAADMRLLQLQFGGILDCQQAFLFRDKRRQSVEHGRLA
jgi:hypothetical protein